MIWLFSAWASLGLDDVLSSLDERVPAMSAAEADLDGAIAKVLAARGSFDPTLFGDVAVYAQKDPRTILRGGVAVKTAPGIKLEAGYLRGQGEFPAYDEDRKTVEEGEVFAGVAIPLGAGFGFSDSLAKLRSVQAGEDEKRAAYADVRRKMRFDASKKYWKWVAAGQALRVAQQQKDLAVRRADALKRQVEEGERARIDLLDNERVLMERESDLLDAERTLMAASRDLSLVWRDEDGEPRLPSVDDIPADWPELPPMVDAPLVRRPDQQKLDAEYEVAEAQRRLAVTQMRPGVDVKLQANVPLGDEKIEYIGGLSVNLPLAMRRARGDKREADARLTSVEERRRGLDDKVAAEIEVARESRTLLARRAEMARDAARLAEEAVDLERRSFGLGASDLFKLLLREDKLASSQMKRIKAEQVLREAVAALDAALAFERTYTQSTGTPDE